MVFTHSPPTLTGAVGWCLVRDDLKLLDYDGEIPKSQERGGRFESRLRNPLST